MKPNVALKDYNWFQYIFLTTGYDHSNFLDRRHKFKCLRSTIKEAFDDYILPGYTHKVGSRGKPGNPPAKEWIESYTKYPLTHYFQMEHCIFFSYADPIDAFMNIGVVLYYHPSISSKNS